MKTKSLTQLKRIVLMIGMTLIEVMLALAIVGVLASVTLPMYEDYKEDARASLAATEISMMSTRIESYADDNQAYPESLADVGFEGRKDPWDRPYVYFNLEKKGNGGARRDRNLNPLNTYYDLYSLGKDGLSKLPITQKDSLDDVIRAYDGKFVDLASKF